MGNKFFGEGNLGADPELHRKQGDDDDQAVCNLRIYFDKPVPNDNGGFDDKGGFWLDVEHWGKRGIACHQLLKKGQRVVVEGSIIQKKWVDNGEEKSRMVIRAKRVSPDIMIVESIKERQGS